jgi:hypothetical protein
MLMAFLDGFTGICAHRTVGWPQHNRQRCLDCGSTRVYDLHRGIRGEWMPPERPYSEAQLPTTTVPGKQVAFSNIRTASSSISAVSHTLARWPAPRAVLLAIAILFGCVVPMAGQSSIGMSGQGAVGIAGSVPSGPATNEGLGVAARKPISEASKAVSTAMRGKDWPGWEN